MSTTDGCNVNPLGFCFVYETLYIITVFIGGISYFYRLSHLFDKFSIVIRKALSFL
jgi:hypothetical protein